MRIVLIGIQGSGKSTQGDLLSKKFSIPFFSSGDIFRTLAKEETDLGKYIKEVMNSGLLIPDDKTIAIITEYLSRPEYKNGYILDGFPRTIIQAEQFKNGVDFTIYLKVSDEEALHRISLRKSARQDETTSAIRKRIELFHTHTEPLLDFYRKDNKLIEIDGEQDIEAIHKQILASLGVA
ncbi:MAG: nucleoside monophosphate kinase [Candidatus Levyibacteriota bacterium]|nr:MAG: nucleoside monophosphate kinase [Candidatus Levybacteria bacterium]